MYQKNVLGLNQVQSCLNTIIAKASNDSDRPVAIAISDDTGELIVYARMDRTPVQSQRFAKMKAYTAARAGSDTGVLAERMRGQGRSIGDFGDPNLIPLQGGVVILAPDGLVIGGVGVSGRSSDEDEKLARLGIEAIKF